MIPVGGGVVAGNELTARVPPLRFSVGGAVGEVRDLHFARPQRQPHRRSRKETVRRNKSSAEQQQPASAPHTRSNLGSWPGA